MIAANYRKHPAAMALQLVLPFGKALIWATKRPTTKAGRVARTLRGRAFLLAGRIRYPEPRVTPSWWKLAQQAARKLAAGLRATQLTCAH